MADEYLHCYYYEKTIKIEYQYSQNHIQQKIQFILKKSKYVLCNFDFTPNVLAVKKTIVHFKNNYIVHFVHTDSTNCVRTVNIYEHSLVFIAVPQQIMLNKSYPEVAT